jgi:hypothetical protein
MTLIEVTCALIVTLLAAGAFFQVFFWGTAHLERSSYRRAGLEVLRGEMERWKSRLEAYPVGWGSAQGQEICREAVQVDSLIGLEGKLCAIVRSGSRDGMRFPYRDVALALTYERSEIEDTLDLEARFYVP